MSVIGSNILAGASGQGGGYNLTNSVRLRSSASAYLGRIPSTNGNRKTWTYSAWVKRGTLGTEQLLISGGVISGTYYYTKGAYFDSSNRLCITNYPDTGGGELVSTSVYRDTSAWYHIVIAVDTTQATNTNRLKMYVNGVQVTTFSTATYPTQNTDTMFNSTSYPMYLGRFVDGFSQYFDGYMAEVNFIDGQALTPSSFGETSISTGVWQPKRFVGTYGTNGFYLPFTNNSIPFTHQGSFNGSTSKLAVAANTAFDLGNAWCVEAWINPTVVNTYQTICGRWISGDPDGWVMYVNYDKLSGGTLANSDYGTSTPTGSIQANIWQHVAMTWDGTTKRLFVNGKVLATSTVSNQVAGSDTIGVTIGANNDNTSPFSGQISNVRVVKGSAVYTTNFTPPTASLTAITGTQLLTLQGSSVVDNSSNAFSITNTSVTTSAVSTFVAIGSDSSGNANNWGVTNISSASGATYDSMTDVPTLTSATASNFATMNPLNAVGTTATFSNANLNVVMVDTASSRTAFATMGVSSGKYYWEATVTTGSINTYYPGVGVNTNLNALPTNQSGGDSTGYMYLSNGQKFNSATLSAYGSSFTTNDVIGVALDMDAGTITFYKNNTTQGQAFSGLSGTAVPCVVGQNNAALAINFGQRPFAYTPPTGFKSLNTYNLPTPTIGATASSQANKYFDIATYNNATVVSGLGFAPDFVWHKSRNQAYNHYLYDKLRGVGAKGLNSNTTSVEGANDALGIVSFDSTGVTYSSDAGLSQTNAVGWFWKANGTGVTNTAGSITSTVSANTTSGFSVVTYTGTGSNATVGHGLGVAPSMAIIKRRSTSGSNWLVYHKSLTATSALYLNTTEAKQTFSDIWNNTEPTSTVMSLGTTDNCNLNGGTYVAYCFSEVQGYSKFGSYTGNGSADGTFVYTGFRPRYILIKNYGAVQGWCIVDTATSTYNLVDSYLQPNSSAAQGSGYAKMDILSNGFKLRDTDQFSNGTSAVYIYAAFAENPFKYSLAR